MKRFLSLLLVVVLLLSLAVPAFANEPVVSALVAVGAMDEPVEGDVAPDIDEPFEGKLAATADTSFPPVYSPESYLIQSLFNCDIELLRPIFKQYKYIYIVLDLSSKKIKQLYLFNFFPFVSPDNSYFNSCVLLFPAASSFSQIVISETGSFNHSFSEAGKHFWLFAPSYSLSPTYFYSFNYKWGSSDTSYVSAISANSLLTYAQTGVVPEEPSVPPDNPNPDLGGGDKTNGFVGEYGAKILLPRNGFKQSKLNTIATKIYYKIPYNGVMTDVKISVGGYIGDRQDVTLHKVQELSGKTVLEGYLDVAGAVSWNKTTPITFTITDYNGKSYTCAVDVTCYDDFIDTDNDGLDDRTNQDDWTGNPDFNKPIYPDNSPPEGANVVEWFKWFFSQIGQFFDTLKSGFDSVVGYGADFSRFLGSAFSYLPSEISVIIGLGFTALVFLRIFGR